MKVYQFVSILALLIIPVMAFADDDHHGSGTTATPVEVNVEEGDVTNATNVEVGPVYATTGEVTNTADGGAGGAASVEINTPKQYKNTPNVYAPSIYGANDCALGASGGIAAAGFGISGGKAAESEECRIWEAVRILGALGNTELSMKVACASIISHWAGFEYCANYRTPPRGWEPPTPPPTVTKNFNN